MTNQLLSAFHTFVDTFAFADGGPRVFIEGLIAEC